MATNRQRSEYRNTSKPTKSAAARRYNIKTDAAVKLPAGQPIEALVKSGRDTAQKQLQAGLELTADNVERVTTHMIKNFDDITTWNKDFFDTYVNACATYAKGCEEISKTWMNTCQNMAQQYAQCCKNMLSAKTMKDAMDTQSDYVRNQFDTLMAEGTKISELCVKLAAETAEPLQSQWNTAVNQQSNNKAAA
ncbi:MAG: phasin family protein [Bdellovibrionales bacterium]